MTQYLVNRSTEVINACFPEHEQVSVAELDHARRNSRICWAGVPLGEELVYISFHEWGPLSVLVPDFRTPLWALCEDLGNDPETLPKWLEKRRELELEAWLCEKLPGSLMIALRAVLLGQYTRTKGYPFHPRAEDLPDFVEWLMSQRAWSWDFVSVPETSEPLVEGR